MDSRPTDLVFRVFGDPAAKGSKRMVRTKTRRASPRIADRVRLIEQGQKKLNRWEPRVRTAAQFAMHEQHWHLVDWAVTVGVVFLIRRPKRGKYDKPEVTPDLDKLLRGLLDPLSGVVYDDDKRVVGCQAIKLYHEQPGAWVRVRPFHLEDYQCAT